MRKFKVVTFLVFCTLALSLCVMEIYAAVYLNVRVDANINYSATDIGAQAWVVNSVNTASGEDLARYVTLTQAENEENNVYYLSGISTLVSNMFADVNSISFTSISDIVEIYVFVKNAGDVSIIPNATIESSNPNIEVIANVYCFSASAGNLDVLSTKNNTDSASLYKNLIDNQLTQQGYSEYLQGSTIEKNDVYLAKFTAKIKSDYSGSVPISSDFSITISFSDV